MAGRLPTYCKQFFVHLLLVDARSLGMIPTRPHGKECGTSASSCQEQCYKIWVHEYGCSVDMHSPKVAT